MSLFKYNTVQVQQTGTRKEEKKERMRERLVVKVNCCYLAETIQNNEGCHSQISSKMHLFSIR
jgi:hypothetical protein